MSNNPVTFYSNNLEYKYLYKKTVNYETTKFLTFTKMLLLIFIENT